MKIEIGAERPSNFVEYWSGQYEVFSHFEYACGIPSPLFAVTTVKENGMPNVCFNAWSSFSGSGEGFYVIMPGISHGSHTYENIMRDKEFVVNFLGKNYYDACIKTIENNGDGADEFAAGGFTREAAAEVTVPRIKEAFLCAECELKREILLEENAKTSIIIGKILHIAMQKDYAQGIDKKYGDSGFMMNIHAPKNLSTGEGKPSALAVCKIVRVNEEG